MGKQTAKGTRAETDVVLWAKKHGYWKADRLSKRGTRDRGDVKITDTVMVQVKDGYTDKIADGERTLRDRKEPTDFQIGQWLDATEKQRKEGGYEVALLVHKRFGNADPDNWRWYIDGKTFMWLVDRDSHSGYTAPYVQLQGYMVPALLAGGGYGT